MVQRFCKIQDVTELCEGMTLIRFPAGEIADAALPGQFVHLRCGDGQLLRRPISICSAKDGIMTIVVQDRGSGTHWLTERRKGDIIDALGPLGHGFDVSSRRSVVIGGGLGVPPMLFAAAKSAEKPDAILGFRSKDAMMLCDEFSAVCKSLTVTTDDGSFGEKATVTVPLERMLKTGGYDSVMACGPVPMLKAIAEICDKYGVRCQVSMEQRMGCGIGACLVCSCETEKDGEKKMSRVCKDGPVFEAGEVKW